MGCQRNIQLLLFVPIYLYYRHYIFETIKKYETGNLWRERVQPLHQLEYTSSSDSPSWFCLIMIWSRLLVRGLHVCFIRCRQLNILSSSHVSSSLMF